jgi:hypothetical protein
VKVKNRSINRPLWSTFKIVINKVTNNKALNKAWVKWKKKLGKSWEQVFWLQELHGNLKLVLTRIFGYGLDPFGSG